MGEATKIEWADHTASPWYGCSEVHFGCDNCYAAAMAKRNPKSLGVWGDDGVRVKSKSFIANLRKWDREAKAAGRIDSVFPSMCDPFEDRPELVPWREEMFAVADECPNIRLLLLTKRPENVQRMWPEYSYHACTTGDCPHERQLECDADKSRWFRENVWLLTSVSDQATADAMVPELLKCRDLVPVLGLSCEPLLGPIDRLPLCHRRCQGHEPSAGIKQLVSALDSRFSGERCGIGSYVGSNLLGKGFYKPAVYCQHCGYAMSGPEIDWVIAGGESGPKARPCRVEHVRSLVKQCKAADVPCFVKQLGSNVVTRNDMVEDAFNSIDNGWPDPDVEHHIHAFREDYQGADCRIRLRDKKGGDWSEWPEDLRVREFPTHLPDPGKKVAT